MQVTFITTPELFEQKFHLAAPLLQPVVDRAIKGELALKDIASMTKSGRFITAVAEHDGQPVMAMSFEFVTYPQQLAVNIVALGGHGLAEIVAQFWETFKAWCRSAGVDMIEAWCGDAMARLLGRYEFKSAYQVVRVQL
jgi:hypothetical protein